ncbi:uncharacterized protein LOC114352093 [Ostrinia furnacalis]|uniref:uncharacterized protein LOC114352093 n=1 Tax=Ostrinia furnacalis TaxID=93504 RepID=UPI00103DC635|nr:uncharacterized protein LOC114352093 [Ostrinia furnacalis]
MIDNWLSTLKIPQIHDKGFREIVVNDLAGDIIDRHKYLELNPSSKGTDESELEQLKYQIFKWVNKLVGEDRHETVEHASELMNKIQSIPVPMLTKQPESGSKNANRVTNRNVNCGAAKANTSANCPSNVRLSSPLGFTTGPMATTNKQNVVQMPLLGPQAPICSLPCKSNTSIKDITPRTGTQSTPHLEGDGNIPQGMSLDEAHQYFDAIFHERLKEIPLETPNPEQEALANLARKGIYNGIWKTYFQLKGDPDIENDYSYFAMVFEDELDKMLDCLPQTNEIQAFRHVWKLKVLSDVLSMLKYVHNMTDTHSFRELIANKLDRQYVRAHNLKGSNLLQHNFVISTAENYILYSKYKEEDPVKANIYKQRLMKKIEELAESVKSQTNVDFKYLNHAQLCQIAFQLLEAVPIPKDENLTHEVEEILIGEEIEQWYNGLPVKPVLNESDKALRKRMRELLARKLHDIEKRIDLNDSAEQNMKHEVSKFLQEKAELQQNADLEINFMVEELTNRLKNRRQQTMIGYESFEKEKPVASTFVQTDPGEVLAALVDVGINAEGASPYYLQEVDAFQGTLADQPQSMLCANQIADSSNQASYQQSMGQMPGPCNRNQRKQSSLQQSAVQAPPPCCQFQGNSGANQTNQNNFYQSMGHPPLPCPQEQDYPGAGVNIGPFRQSMAPISGAYPQGQGVFGTSQVAGPYQQQEQLPQCCQDLGTRQGTGSVGFGPIERPIGAQSSYDPRSGYASDRSQIQPANQAEASGRIYQDNLPPDYVQMCNQGNIGAPGQTVSGVPPSTDFLTTQDPTPTARVASAVPDQEPIDEETDGEEEIYKCHCMERIWKCKKHRVYEDMGRRPRCYPMPMPCRYFY